MTDKEVDVLIDFIVENDESIICENMFESDFCEKYCKEYLTLNKECVKEYARVVAKENEQCKE